MKRMLPLILTIGLVGCSGDQLAKIATSAAKAEPVLERACAAAVQLSLVAGLVPGVGAIVPYINEGCRTAQGIAKLAADPTSLEWLGELRGKITVLADKAGMKL